MRDADLIQRRQHQKDDSDGGFATAAMNPSLNLQGRKIKPQNLGMDGINRTRFTPFNVLASINISKKALPDNRWRNYIMIQNNSAADIYIGFGINIIATGENGFVLSGGGYYELDTQVPFNAIFVTGTIASQQVLIVEGTIDRAQ